MIKNARTDGSSEGDWSMVTGTKNSDMNKSASGRYIYLYYNRSE